MPKTDNEGAALMRYFLRLSMLMLAALVMGVPALSLAQDDVVTIEGARIRGDQEVPLVLYLVPWKPPEARSLERPDEQLMLARPIKRLERAEFQRLMSYHEHFQALNAKTAAGKGSK